MFARITDGENRVHVINLHEMLFVLSMKDRVVVHMRGADTPKLTVVENDKDSIVSQIHRYMVGQ